jgi:hypothetical protein
MGGNSTGHIAISQDALTATSMTGEFSIELFAAYVREYCDRQRLKKISIFGLQHGRCH